MIGFSDDPSGVTALQIEPFFDGWAKKPSIEKRLKILQNSDLVILAFDDEKLIGFINAITDKTLSAYIPLLEVLPEYRGRGTGKELINRMLNKLNGMYMVDLCCDESLSQYYQNLGFNEARGMIRRNYENI